MLQPYIESATTLSDSLANFVYTVNYVLLDVQLSAGSQFLPTNKNKCNFFILNNNSDLFSHQIRRDFSALHVQIIVD